MSAQTGTIEQWENVKSNLRVEFGDATFQSWIAPLTVNSIREGVVTLEAPNRFVATRVESSYDDRIRAAWRRRDPGVRRVIYRVETEKVAAMTSGQHAAAHNGAHSPANDKSDDRTGSRRSAEATPALYSVRLNERLCFENYVVGRPNEFAFAAAKRVSEAEYTPFNPLFLYGQSGLGKTHLLHSIAWRRKELYPNEKHLFISAETFLSEFMHALRHNDTRNFKDSLRSADMLIIDDIHIIMGRDRTQEEFFHTFNWLADQQRQIVLSADRSPNSMDGLDERLRSRLGWGLVADLHPTDYELRLGILQSKTEAALAKSDGLQVDPAVLEFLARRISENVRTLEGALNRLFAAAALVGRPATVEMAQRELQDLLKKSNRKISIEEIQRRVAEHFNIRVADMHSPRRARSVARPRQIAMYLAKQLTQKSLPDIGEKFGGRDHTTVMHAVRKINELRLEDSAFDDDVERLRRMLEA